MKQQTKKIFESYIGCISESFFKVLKTFNKGNVKIDVIYDSSEQEYIAKYFIDGKESEDDTYYAGDDKEDAIATAKAMIAKVNKSKLNEERFDTSIKYSKKDSGDKLDTYYFDDNASILAAKKDLEKQGFKKNDKDVYVKGSDKAKVDVALTSKGGGTITFMKD